MSATRDTSTNTKFVFSNFYHLYLQSKVQASLHPAALDKGLVLRAGRVTSAPMPAQVHVVNSHGQENLKKWTHGETKEHRKSLANQISELRSARKRLTFLLSEMDDLLKRE